MSIKEQCVELLNSVPDFKLGYVLAYLQGLTADDAADEAFCQAMLEGYRNDPDPEKNKGFTLDECKREWGLA